MKVQLFSNSKGNQATIFVAAPHTYFFDAFVFFVLGMPAVVSRDANGKIPLIGRLIKSNEQKLNNLLSCKGVLLNMSKTPKSLKEFFN